MGFRVKTGTFGSFSQLHYRCTCGKKQAATDRRNKLKLFPAPIFERRPYTIIEKR